MNVCERAIYRWGFENVRTIAVVTLWEEYGEEQAEELFEALVAGEKN
jgi:hypothetical protein